MAVTVNEGTQTDIYSTENAGTEIQIVKLDIGAGSAISDFGGSISSVGKGTIQNDPTPPVIGTSYGTLGTAGAATWGTLIAAAGAGTYQYVSGVDIIVASGTVDVAVTNIGIGGSTGAGVLARGQFTPGGGISKNFNPIQRSGTNGTLSYWLGGAGTASIAIQYWQGT